MELLVRPILERINPGWLYLWVAFYGCSFSVLAAYVASAAAASIFDVYHRAN